MLVAEADEEILCLKQVDAMELLQEDTNVGNLLLKDIGEVECTFY